MPMSSVVRARLNCIQETSSTNDAVSQGEEATTDDDGRNNKLTEHSKRNVTKVADDDEFKGKWSDTIRIHRLPRRCSLQHIQKFFSGLDPQRIFLLPPLHHTIPAFDNAAEPFISDCAGSEETKNRKAAAAVQSKKEVLYHPTHVRVFVKFKSNIIANLALQRSGEPMICATSSSSSSSSSSSTKEGRTEISSSIPIYLRPVPKAIRNFVDRFMAIDVMKEPPLDDWIQRIHDSTPAIKLVYNILWLAMQQQTNVDVAMKTVDISFIPSCTATTTTTSTTSIDTKYIFNLHPPHSWDEYIQLSSLYNILWDIHYYLERSQRPFQALTQDEMDGGYNLVHSRVMTIQAGIWLVEQMTFIQGCINHYS